MITTASDPAHFVRPTADALSRYDNFERRLDGLRGMAWAYAVLSATGLSGSAASKVFSGPVPIKLNPAGRPILSNIFYKYLRGERAPIPGPRGKHGFDLVGLVAAHPTAAEANGWLTHRLFQVLEPDAKIEWLADLLEEASEPIRAGLASTVSKDSPAPIVDALGNPIELLHFDDFVAVCGWLHATKKTGHYSPGHWVFVRHLYPQAARLEPVFDFISAPFIKMMDDFVCAGPHDRGT